METNSVPEVCSANQLNDKYNSSLSLFQFIKQPSENVWIHLVICLLTVVNILPVGQLGVTLLYGDVLTPLLHPVENPLVNNRLELPGKEDLATASGLQLSPVLGQEIIGAAAAPVDNVFVLTLAALLPLPVGQVEVVVDVGHAVVGVPQDGVEEGLGWQESVREDRLEAGDELVAGEKQSVPVWQTI